MSDFNSHVNAVLEKHIFSDLTREKIAFEMLEPFGGQSVYIAIPFKERNEKIKRQHKSGVSAKAIAASFNLTERSVYNIIKKYR